MTQRVQDGSSGLNGDNLTDHVGWWVLGLDEIGVGARTASGEKRNRDANEEKKFGMTHVRVFYELPSSPRNTLRFCS